MSKTAYIILADGFEETEAMGAWDALRRGGVEASFVSINETTAVEGESLKGRLGSDRGLQLGPVKVESLVIADQQRCGEYVLGPCTHRPSRHESW